MDVHEVLVRAQLALTLLKCILQDLLLLLETLDVFKTLVLHTIKLLLPFLDLFLKRFLFMLKPLSFLHAFHGNTFSVDLDVFEIHFVEL